MGEIAEFIFKDVPEEELRRLPDSDHVDEVAAHSYLVRCAAKSVHDFVDMIRAGQTLELFIRDIFEEVYSATSPSVAPRAFSAWSSGSLSSRAFTLIDVIGVR